ncbi:MAG: TVP38/TMEM64 family protein [Gemmatimonadota bacterium]|nr:TVP38/TMEM64 family protein [Gemmatimonadota bacterium]
MEEFFYSVGDWMAAAGPWAYVIAPLLMAGVAILPIPAEAPAMVNGMLFGPIAGTAVTWCGAMLGAVASFEIARSLGRPVAERFVRPEALRRADDLVMRAGWWGLLLARFMPLIAFTVLNWGAGLTPVKRWRFLWTTAIGIIPGAIVFTVSGWGVAGLLEQLPLVGLAVAIVLAVWLWWRARLADPYPAEGRGDEDRDRT